MRPTRGHGLLESTLASLRRKQAMKLLRPLGKINSLLDIGCGQFPALLFAHDAAERVGIDRSFDADVVRLCAEKGVRLVDQDFARNATLPFDAAHFDAVSMLAVVEHVPIASATELCREIHRLLKPGGSFVLTTPAAWTDGILRTMARLALVSAEEIDEHESLYRQQDMRRLLEASGFQAKEIATGTFELGMNLWACGIKSR